MSSLLFFSSHLFVSSLLSPNLFVSSLLSPNLFVSYLLLSSSLCILSSSLLISSYLLFFSSHLFVSSLLSFPLGQLERLDRQYHIALESLADQKCGATRWMARQKVLYCTLLYCNVLYSTLL